MTLALLIPAGLAALAALLLPALIHLARRDEEKLTDFAALRWLRQKPKPRQRLRIDEWPLLLLRLLLIALLALWLARPVLNGEDDRTPWTVAVPGVDVAQARAVATDDAEVRWLAPGFPAIATAPPAGPVPIASLLRQLDAELPAGASLTLLVPERLSSADGERPRLSRAVTWRVVAGAMPTPRHPATATPSLAVRHAPERAPSLRYLRAAAIAWQRPGRPAAFSAASADVPLPADGSVLVWLVPGPLPSTVDGWIRRGGTALVDAATKLPSATRFGAWHDDLGAPLAEEMAVGRGRLLRLTRPLTPAAMPQLLEPDFPQQLRELLAPPAAAPSSVRAADFAPLTGGRSYPQAARELQPWLALLIAALLIVERWFATGRSRRVTP